mgnify:CR=1 FL=1
MVYFSADVTNMGIKTQFPDMFKHLKGEFVADFFLIYHFIPPYVLVAVSAYLFLNYLIHNPRSLAAPARGLTLLTCSLATIALFGYLPFH